MRIGTSFVCATVLALASVPAMAQDWAGNFGSVSLGYGSGTYDQGVSSRSQVGPEVDVNGTMLALRYARNWQNASNVYGFDVGVSTGIDGIAPRGTSSDYWSCNTGDCNIDIKSIMTLRGKYGFLVDPATLLYGVGGLAVGNIEGGILNSEQQGTSTATGYTVGVGAERFINPTTTIFGEVNYVDLGDLDFGTGDSTADRYDGVGDFTTVNLGVSFKF